MHGHASYVSKDNQHGHTCGWWASPGNGRNLKRLEKLSFPQNRPKKRQRASGRKHAACRSSTLLPRCLRKTLRYRKALAVLLSVPTHRKLILVRLRYSLRSFPPRESRAVSQYVVLIPFLVESRDPT